MRDTRMVERKKTGSAKARKKVSAMRMLFPRYANPADSDSTLGSSDDLLVHLQNRLSYGHALVRGREPLG